MITLPVLEKVRLVFSEDQRAREALESDANPLVRKAIKVKISKTVHKYLNPATEHEIRLRAAQGNVPLSTTEKLVLLSYLSHDESQQIRDEAKNTLATLDVPTFRKGFGSDLHPSVMDFLVRETIRDPSLIKLAASCETILEETALHILEKWKDEEVILALSENKKLLERSPAVSEQLASQITDSDRRKQVDIFEESLLLGQTEMKVEGPLSVCGLAGLMRAARHGMRSGTIVLEGPSKSGRVYFKRGKIVGAVWDGLEGMPALEEMVNVKESSVPLPLEDVFPRGEP